MEISYTWTVSKTIGTPKVNLRDTLMIERCPSQQEIGNVQTRKYILHLKIKVKNVVVQVVEVIYFYSTRSNVGISLGYFFGCLIKYI